MASRSRSSLWRIVSLQRQYSLSCSSTTFTGSFCATRTQEMTSSFILRQFSSTLEARKRDVAAML